MSMSKEENKIFGHGVAAGMIFIAIVFSIVVVILANNQRFDIECKINENTYVQVEVEDDTFTPATNPSIDTCVIHKFQG